MLLCVVFLLHSAGSSVLSRDSVVVRWCLEGAFDDKNVLVTGINVSLKCCPEALIWLCTDLTLAAEVLHLAKSGVKLVLEHRRFPFLCSWEAALGMGIRKKS